MKRNTNISKHFLEAYSNWQPVAPNFNWSNLKFDLDLFQSSSTHSTEFNSDNAWDKLSDELDFLHNVNADINSIEPTLSSLNSVWDKLDASLNSSNHTFNKTIENELKRSFDEWQPEFSDKWEMLNETLSTEKVWNNLNVSLVNQRWIGNQFFYKALASVVCVFVFFSSFNDEIFRNSPQNIENSFISKIYANNSALTISSSEKSKSNVLVEKDIFKNRSIAQRSVVENSIRLKNIETIETFLHKQDSITIVNSLTPLTELDPISSSDTFSKLETLDLKNLSLLDSLKSLRLHNLFTYKSLPHPFSVSLGLHSIRLEQNNNDRSLTTLLPRIGFSAGIKYTLNFGLLGVGNTLKFNQFNQITEKYINGRHQRLTQHFSSIQYIPSIIFSKNRLSAYSGLSLNKFITGFEYRHRTLTSIYKFEGIQTGVVVGLEYKFRENKVSKHWMSIGIDYQYIPNLGKKSNSFMNLNALGFLLKYTL